MAVALIHADRRIDLIKLEGTFGDYAKAHKILVLMHRTEP
jgi:hypothetical protein